MMLKRFALAAVAAFIAAPATAQVYRCTDDTTGKVIYADTPCQRSAAGGVVPIEQNTLDTSGSREQALKLEIKALRQRVDALESGAAAPRYGRTESDLHAERADSFACQQAKRSLDIEAGSGTSTRASVEAKAAAMRIACGVREPDRVEINTHDRHGPFDRHRR